MDPKLLSELDRCIDIALEEDDIENDITSLGCLPQADPVEAKLYLKEKSPVSGIAFLPHIFQRFNPHLRVQLNALDGEEYEKGTILAQIIGDAREILCLERTVINLISHLSGITKLTRDFVLAAAPNQCDILDTRKTLPGMRHLQKYAVRMGGGKNHRLSLSDKILIKDNHLSILKQKTSANIFEAIGSARARYPMAHLEIEVSTIDELREALESKPDSILLDNMNPTEVRESVINAKEFEKVYLEASGGITLSNVAKYAATGVDGIAIGALTHSAKSIDISLKM